MYDTERQNNSHSWPPCEMRKFVQITRPNPGHIQRFIFMQRLSTHFNLLIRNFKKEGEKITTYIFFQTFQIQK